MSNGLTSVFIETLCLAGAESTDEEFKKEIMIWFAQRDLMGMGFEGFDISEIIWDNDIFDKQKSFIIETIEKVFEEKNWNLLDYTPNKEWLFDSLNKFKKMISEYEK